MTAAGEMGGYTIRGGGGPAAAMDLPIRPMGGRTGGQGARVAEDGGRRP
jgi:hypothetical protein